MLNTNLRTDRCCKRLKKSLFLVLELEFETETYTNARYEQSYLVYGGALGPDIRHVDNMVGDFLLQTTHCTNFSQALRKTGDDSI
jgi:hypothetical protein